MKKFSVHILLSTFLVAILGLIFYQYANQKIPEKVIQSQKTIIDIDSLRFTFKISIMAQKGLSTYQQAILQQSPEQLEKAKDYFYAALAFTDPALLNNKKLPSTVSILLKKVINEIEHGQLQPSSQARSGIMESVQELTRLTSQEEREAWTLIQKDYIDFKTHEFKTLQIYQTLTVAFLAFLLLVLWLTLRQQKLIKQNRKQQKDLQQLAYFDSLTSIANRKNIEQSLEEKIKLAQQNGSRFYIALIDLDDFKNINDLLGHYAGDKLLQKTVSIFNSIIRSDDHIGRLGGDEFLITFNNYTNQTQLISIISQIQNAFNKPIIVDGSEFKVTISIGIASYPKDVDTQVEQITQHLIKSADIAMYEAKKRGKNQFHFFDSMLETQIKLEHQMDKDIFKAIELNEFELYYQPQIDSKSKQVVGAEALIRWNHPQKGLVMPGEFIEFIEKGLHTAEFGEWVIENTIKQQQAWLEKGIDIAVSLNLSVKHILSVNFYESVTDIIERTGADLNKLHFEITEYELIQSQEIAIQDLNKLQAYGFKFHLDDFGTGYSSLSYLSQLPIEAIKIDKSFIDYIVPQQEKKNLVEAIIHIGDTLNKEVIAEGVENAYQIEFLQASGCETLQGYYFSKPIKASEFEQFYFEFNKPSA